MPESSHKKWKTRVLQVVFVPKKAMEKYDYFIPMDDPETVLLIDSWRDQKALEAHHASPMMKELADLREKYDLHMRVERYISDDSGVPASDQKFIRK